MLLESVGFLSWKNGFTSFRFEVVCGDIVVGVRFGRATVEAPAPDRT